MMFKKMTLGAKIATGFAFVLLTALALGGIAFFSTSSIVGSSETLSRQYMPAVQIANDIERHYNKTNSEINNFSYTGDRVSYDTGLENLQKAKEFIDQAEKLTGSGGLAQMKQSVLDLKAAVVTYEEMVAKTLEISEGMDRSKKVLDRTAQTFLKTSNDLLSNEKNQILLMQFQSGKSKATENVADKINRINLLYEVINSANEVRIASLRLLSDRDVATARASMANFDAITTKIGELKNLITSESVSGKLMMAETALTAFSSAMNDLIVKWEEMVALNTERVTVANDILTKTEAVARKGIESTSTIANDTTGVVSWAAGTVVIGLLVTLVVGIFLAYTITRGITGSITKVIDGLTRGAEQVHAAAGQVSASSSSMAEGASSQASSLEEVSSSLEEMASMTKQNAENAKQANTLAHSARESAQEGNTAMQRMTEAIHRIKSSADETAKIVKTIDEIAFQTNLLALNAAVEAARAGDAGKGFAVVAEEVRSLAQRSAEAAKNTSQLIEESQRNSANGVQVSGEVAKILNQIVDDSSKVSGLVSEVAAASEEQAQGIEQINRAVSQMDQVTQSNAANAEESSASSKELATQASELTKMVETLITMVGKSGRSKNGLRTLIGLQKKSPKQLPRQGQRPAGPPSRRAIRPGAAAPATRRGDKEKVIMKPEQVIPLEDEELSDF